MADFFRLQYADGTPISPQKLYTAAGAVREAKRCNNLAAWYKADPARIAVVSVGGTAYCLLDVVIIPVTVLEGAALTVEQLGHCQLR